MSFITSTNKFLKSADWLTDIDEPAITALRAAAKSLDEVLNPPVLAQYRLLYNGLIKARPVAVPDEDETATALREAGLLK